MGLSCPRCGCASRHYGDRLNRVHVIQMELAKSTCLSAEMPPWDPRQANADRLRGHPAQILETLNNRGPCEQPRNNACGTRHPTGPDLTQKREHCGCVPIFLVGRRRDEASIEEVASPLFSMSHLTASNALAPAFDQRYPARLSPKKMRCARPVRNRMFLRRTLGRFIVLANDHP